MNLYDAGKKLGVSYNTVRKYVRLGLLPATKIGKSYRVSDEAVESALRDGIDLSSVKSAEATEK